MKRTICAAVLISMAVLLTSETSYADTFRYRLSGDWNTVTDGISEGWGLNPNNDGSPGIGLPGLGDDARINWGGNTVTVTSAVPAVGRVQIGVDESGTVLVANGGVLTASASGGDGDIFAGNNNSNAMGSLIVASGGIVNVERILWAANNNADGYINVNSGGLVNVASHLWLGVTGTATIDLSGTLNQTGGILGLGTNNASTASGGTAIVNILDGGLLALNNIDGSGNSIFGSSAINISGSGQLTLPGDFVGVLTNYANAGQLVGVGGNLAIDFDATNAGSTTAYITVIPEPTSVVFLGVLLGGTMINRRRR